jgi:hypothetical protein
MVLTTRDVVPPLQAGADYDLQVRGLLMLPCVVGA